MKCKEKVLKAKSEYFMSTVAIRRPNQVVFASKPNQVINMNMWYHVCFEFIVPTCIQTADWFKDLCAVTQASLILCQYVKTMLSRRFLLSQSRLFFISGNQVSALARKECSIMGLYIIFADTNSTSNNSGNLFREYKKHTKGINRGVMYFCAHLSV